MAQTRFPFYLPPPRFLSSFLPFFFPSLPLSLSLSLSITSPSVLLQRSSFFLAYSVFLSLFFIFLPFSFLWTPSSRFAEELAHATGKNNANKRGWQDWLVCVDNWHFVNSFYPNVDFLASLFSNKILVSMIMVRGNARIDIDVFLIFTSNMLLNRHCDSDTV